MRNRRTRPLYDRLHEKLIPEPNSGCWLFTGAVNENGYGSIGIGGRKRGNVFAHRAAWMLYHGEIPDGMYVCHRCDVPSCCNPDHLFLGTAKDNFHDCMKKGRAVMPPVTDWPAIIRQRGHHWQTSTIEQVSLAKRLLREGVRNIDVGRATGLTQSVIEKIKDGSRWQHVP
jgi:hypothetical protein